MIERPQLSVPAQHYMPNQPSSMSWLLAINIDVRLVEVDEIRKMTMSFAAFSSIVPLLSCDQKGHQWRL